MSSLKKSQTRDDIVAAIIALNPEINTFPGAKAQMDAYWLAIIGALYDRITADLIMELNSPSVAAGSFSNGAGAVSGTGLVSNITSKVQ